MRTLKFICHCRTKEDGMKFARLMQRLGVKWAGTNRNVTSNTIRWNGLASTYFVDNGHLQKGYDYLTVASYAERHDCKNEIEIENIKEDLTVAQLKSFYHEI